MKFIRGVLTWQAVGPFAVYVLLALLIVLYLALDTSLNNARHSLGLAGQSSGRINSLQIEINKLEHQLRSSQVHDAKKRGQLENAIRALANQVRQAGGEPVVTFPLSSGGQTSPHSSSDPSRSPTTHNSSPKPQPTKPTPTSSPSPTPSSHPLACVTTIDHGICIH